MARPSKKINNSDNSEYIPGENENDKKESNESPESQLGAYLSHKDNKSKHFNFEEDVTYKVSFGSALIDAAAGQLGPGICRLVGNNNEGKSPESLEIMRNFLNTVPDSRGLLILAEGRQSEENRNRCKLIFVDDYKDWKDGTVFVLQSNNYEFIINLVRELVKNNPTKRKYCLIFDSVDGLILDEDNNKSSEDSHRVAGPQLLTKKFLQSMNLELVKRGHLCLMLSQVTAEIKLDPYTKTPNRGGNFSGGNALLHYADIILSYNFSYPSDYILDNPKGKLNDGKSKAIGKWCKITIEKSNKEATRKQTLSYPIKFGRTPSGIWQELELIEVMLAFSMITKETAWIKIGDELLKELKEKNLPMEDKFQGMDNFRKFLEDNQNTTDYLSEKIRLILSS